MTTIGNFLSLSGNPHGIPKKLSHLLPLTLALRELQDQHGITSAHIREAGVMTDLTPATIDMIRLARYPADYPISNAAGEMALRELQLQYKQIAPPKPAPIARPAAAPAAPAPTTNKLVALPAGADPATYTPKDTKQQQTAAPVKTPDVGRGKAQHSAKLKRQKEIQPVFTWIKKNLPLVVEILGPISRADIGRRLGYSMKNSTEIASFTNFYDNIRRASDDGMVPYTSPHFPGSTRTSLVAPLERLTDFAERMAKVMADHQTAAKATAAKVVPQPLQQQAETLLPLVQWVKRNRARLGVNLKVRSNDELLEALEYRTPRKEHLRYLEQVINSDDSGWVRVDGHQVFAAPESFLRDLIGRMEVALEYPDVAKKALQEKFVTRK